jgi:hypothetical protein
MVLNHKFLQYDKASISKMFVNVKRAFNNAGTMRLLNLFTKLLTVLVYLSSFYARISIFISDIINMKTFEVSIKVGS